VSGRQCDVAVGAPNPLVCAGEAGRLARTLHGSALPHDYATEGIDRKCCAAGALGVPGISGTVMVSPGHAVVTGVSSTSDCSARTAADSWPHPGLVELLNVANTTPRGRRGLPWLVSDVRCSMDVEMPIMLWTSSVNCVNPLPALNGPVRNPLSLN
jgi:hypothetical protein